MALVRLYVGLDMGIYCVVPCTTGSMSSRMKQLLIGLRLVSCSEEELRPGSDKDSTAEPVASSLSCTGALVLVSYSVDGFLSNSPSPAGRLELFWGPGDHDGQDNPTTFQNVENRNRLFISLSWSTWENRHY